LQPAINSIAAAAAAAATSAGHADRSANVVSIQGMVRNTILFCSFTHFILSFYYSSLAFLEWRFAEYGGCEASDHRRIK